MKIVKVKDKLGVVKIDQKKIKRVCDIATGEYFDRWSLNLILLEDGTLVAAQDSEMEIVKDDWTEEIDSEN